MTRLRTLSLACVGFIPLLAAPAAAQTVGPVLPAYSPDVPPAGQFFNGGVPITGFVPGLNYAPGNTVSFNGPRATAYPFYYNGFATPYGLPYSPYGMFAYDAPLYGGYYAPYYLAFTSPLPSNDFVAPPVLGAGTGSMATVTLAGLPASLSIQFPAQADVWLNGKRVAGSSTLKQDFTSPAIKAGQDYTFDVKAEWTADGKAYEYSRAVKVPSGDRAKITVVSGTPKGEGKAVEK